MLLYALPIVDWLSQCMQIAGISFDHLKISSSKWQSHSVSSATLSSAMNSNSIVDLAIQVCFENFYEAAARPSVKIYLLVDFESFISDIQFASLYPSNTLM